MAMAIFHNNFRKDVAMVTEDKSVVTTDDDKTVAEVTRCGYSILIIYEHAL